MCKACWIAIACVLLAVSFARPAPSTAAPAAGSHACGHTVGERVALLGEGDDPDVFLWDSRFRLAAYQTGSWDVDRALLPHARLIAAGTRAVVIACVPNFVHPKYRSGTDDAVGVRISRGKLKGTTGWALGSDVRALRLRRWRARSY